MHKELGVYLAGYHTQEEIEITVDVWMKNHYDPITDMYFGYDPIWKRVIWISDTYTAEGKLAMRWQEQAARIFLLTKSQLPPDRELIANVRVLSNLAATGWEPEGRFIQDYAGLCFHTFPHLKNKYPELVQRLLIHPSDINNPH